MTDKETDALLEFPCSFPIKMMGRDTDQFRNTALSILQRHVGQLPDSALNTTPSSKGNFISITATIDAQSQDQLDAIYEDLTQDDDILVAL